MGRLFWRFFWFFWLAQIATSLALGVTVWVLRPVPETALTSLIQPPSHAPSLFPLLMPIVIGGLISLAFAALMASFVTRPIQRIYQAFQAVASGRLDERIGGELGRPSHELAALGPGFDHMASRLQALVNSQRRLLHDVSHELRAPLARLQAALDLVERSAHRKEELHARMHLDIHKMKQLVDELLTLARLEADGKPDLPEPFALHEVLDSVAEDARFEAQQKDCVVEVECPPDLDILGNPELIFRAIDNVVRNAVRHTPGSSRVRVTAGASDQRFVKIRITDAGAGVPADELAAIFDPFVRGAADRGDGYGLGLAITRRAIESHGGSVTALNLPEGGFAVEIILPLR